ncbi:hypothetical protein LY76DRAFT_228426 [Colletotrichum caudatum]|nr:hypothetical protein LY76DRAFT_228426 [Colletotrichum caudatum]
MREDKIVAQTTPKSLSPTMVELYVVFHCVCPWRINLLHSWVCFLISFFIFLAGMFVSLPPPLFVCSFCLQPFPRHIGPFLARQGRGEALPLNPRLLKMQTANCTTPRPMSNGLGKKERKKGEKQCLSAPDCRTSDPNHGPQGCVPRNQNKTKQKKIMQACFRREPSGLRPRPGAPRSRRRRRRRMCR